MTYVARVGYVDGAATSDATTTTITLTGGPDIPPTHLTEKPRYYEKAEAK